VVHLVADNIYLDLRFDNWAPGQDSGYSYQRAEPPAMPTTTGDYNENGVVDAADYVLWRKTLDQTVATPGDGADGDLSGIIDAGDYAFWRARFGNIIGGPGLGADVIAAVPEPGSAFLWLYGLIGLPWCRARTRHIN
jgi:hypothetical protein